MLHAFLWFQQTNVHNISSKNFPNVYVLLWLPTIKVFYPPQLKPLGSKEDSEDKLYVILIFAIKAVI